MLDTKYATTDEGVEKLKKGVSIRNQMGGALYFSVLEDECLMLADRLTADGVDKKKIAEIGGWELRNHA